MPSVLALSPGLGKTYLCNDAQVLVTRYHIDYVVREFEREGLLSTDDLAGFSGLLHKIAVMRDKVGNDGGQRGRRHPARRLWYPALGAKTTGEFCAMVPVSKPDELMSTYISLVWWEYFIAAIENLNVRLS